MQGIKSIYNLYTKCKLACIVEMFIYRRKYNSKITSGKTYASVGRL